MLTIVINEHRTTSKSIFAVFKLKGEIIMEANEAKYNELLDRDMQDADERAINDELENEQW